MVSGEDFALRIWRKKEFLRKTGRVDSACANKLHTPQGLDYVIVSLHRGIVGL